MVTVRRSTEDSSLFTQQGRSAVGLLEREMVNTTVPMRSNASDEETVEQAKERMQRNLDKLLNYDKVDESVIEEVPDVVDMSLEQEQSEEDIRPTSTTLQFNVSDVKEMYNEMDKTAVKKESYHLSSKGKLVVVLYALAVAVIMALIMINTGVLASLSRTNEVKREELNDLVSEYSTLNETVESISSNEHVLEIAGDYGMVPMS